MINLQTAENALKTFYLDAVKDLLDTKTSPLLSMVERTSENVYGKEVKKAIRVGLSGGVAAGTETGDLPKADPSNYMQLTAPLKNLYGTIEISDKAIRASQGNEGAFVNLLNAEMDNLFRSAKYNFGRMIMGNGKGIICYGKVNKNGKFVANDTSALHVGMGIVFTETDGSPADEEERKIKSVDRETGIVEVTGSELPWAENGEAAIAALGCGEEICGVQSLFDNETLYGLTTEQYQSIAPKKVSLGSYINWEDIQKMVDIVEEECGTTPNLIICGWGMRRAIVRHCMDMGMTLPTMQIEGGYTALNFNGIPIVTDRFCPKGTLYFLNTNDIKLYQLGDWEWMESDDGKILHQVPGKPVYTATLVKYAELVFERPNAVACLTDIKED